MKRKTRKVILFTISTLGLFGLSALTFLRVFLAPKFEEFEEFVRVEDAKSEWIAIIEFKNTKNRYPYDLDELSSHFQYTSSEENIIYLPPRDNNTDEIILWLKRESKLGNRIGVRESGIVVKTKTE